MDREGADTSVQWVHRERLRSKRRLPRSRGDATGVDQPYTVRNTFALQSLTNRCSPIFDRKLWESLSYPSRVPARLCLPIEAEGDCYSLPKPLGFWCVDNPVVWDVLEPVLRLASRIITLSHTSTFVTIYPSRTICAC